MKILPLLSLIALASISSFAQREISGHVTQIISGDTFVLQTRSVDYSIKLQFVDAPEPGQPMYAAAKDHLSQFVLNKDVSFELASISSGVFPARIVVDGADLSAQMLRDGAAWYCVPDADRQEASERAAYLAYEKLARNEKRGIWGIEGLTPTYELRAQRAQRLKEMLAEQEKEIDKELIALSRLTEPKLGMPLAAFDHLCPPKSGDQMTNGEGGGGPWVSKTLVYSEDRERSKCWGSFEFFTNLRLTSVVRSTSYK
jgi:endonuclease YncB( thermonuclease family)